MRHSEWVGAVEGACGWAECFGGGGWRLRLYRRVMVSYPASVIGRSILWARGAE